MPPPSTSRKPPLPALTGIRAPLALGIVFFHFTPPRLHFLYPLIDNAFTFVGFFFLLSGFVLAYNYADRPSPPAARDFYFARLARLYPLYLFSLLLFLPFLLGEYHARPHSDFYRGLLLTPLLLQGWSPSLATFWNTVAWTLSCEAMLYAAFPGILHLWRRHRARLDTPARLFGLLLLLWIVGILPHIAYLLFNPDHLTAPANRYTSAPWIRTLKYTPFPYLATFLAGFTLGCLQNRLPLSRTRRTVLALTGLAAIGLISYSSHPVPYILLHGGLLIPAYAALTLGLAGPSLLSPALSARPVVLLGEASFALYLLHFNTVLLLQSTHAIARLHLTPLDPWITYALLLALALAALHVIEIPARRAILAGLASRTPRPAAT